MNSRQWLCRSCIRSIFPDVHHSLVFPRILRSSASRPRSFVSASKRLRQHTIPETDREPVAPFIIDAPTSSPAPEDGVNPREYRNFGFRNADSQPLKPTRPASALPDYGPRPPFSEASIRSQGFPAPADYPFLPSALFSASSGSGIERTFQRCKPETLRIESDIQFIPQSSSPNTWRQQITATLPDAVPINAIGEGNTADEAVLCSYLSLILCLHRQGTLAQFRLTRSTLDKPAYLPNDQYLKLQVYNYAARFGLVPKFGIKTSSSDSPGSSNSKLSRFLVEISLPDHGVSVSGEYYSLSTAEAIAAYRFRQRIEEMRLQGSLPTLNLRDPNALNVDIAPGFLSFYLTRVPSTEFRYKSTKIPFGTETHWATRVLMNGQPCGKEAVMFKMEISRMVANLLAALELSKRRPDVLQEYLQAINDGKASLVRPGKPFALNLDRSTVDTLHEIYWEAEQMAISNPLRISQRDLIRAYGRLRPTTTLPHAPRFRSAKPVDTQMSGNRLAELSQLPVYQHAADIVHTINENIFSVIVGSTGSGKSTQIPQLLLQNAIQQKSETVCNICCSQPTRAAVQALAQRVAFERNEQVGDVVGYRISNERILPRTDQGITFTTAEVLQLQLSYGWDVVFDRFSHIIVDEVHERDGPTESLLMTLKMLAKSRIASGKPVPRIVLMSATVHTDLFMNYFGSVDPVTQETVPCPVLEIPGRLHDVETRTLGDVLADLNDKIQDPALQGLLSDPSHARFLDIERGLSDQSSSVVAPTTVEWKSEWEVVKEREEWQMSFSLVAASIANICAFEGEGSILTFLPGWKEMRTVHDLLRLGTVFGIDFQNEDRFQFVFLHSINPDGLREVMLPPRPGVRRIILSTNIAETSLTIPDVRYVIDSGKNRTPTFDHVRQFTKVDRTWISQTSMVQRAGRAGRVQPGVYLALFSDRRMSQLNQLSKKHSIRQSRLQKTCLRAREQFPDMPLEEYFGETIDPPNLREVRSAIRDLQAMGALTAELEMTYLGRVLSKFPGQPSVSRMVLIGALFRCLDPMIVVGAAMSTSKSLFVTPESRDDWIRAKAIRSIYAQGSGSDHVANVYAFNEIRMIHDREGLEAAQEWAADSFLNFAAYQDISNFYKKVAVSLSGYLHIHRTLGQAWNINSTNTEVIKALAFAGLYPNVATNRGGKVFATSSGVDAILPNWSTLMMSLDKVVGDWSPDTGFPHPLADAICCYSDLNVGMVGERGLLRDVSSVSPLVAALFGGRLEVDAMAGPDARPRNGDGVGVGNDADGSPVAALLIGGWLPARVDSPDMDPAEATQALVRFKGAWDRLLSQILETISLNGVKKQILSEDSVQRAFVDGIIRLISSDFRRDQHHAAGEVDSGNDDDAKSSGMSRPPSDDDNR